MRTTPILFSTLAVTLALTATPGCVALERKIVSTKVKEAFEATLTPGTEHRDLGRGLHTFRWLSYRNLWLETPSGVVVFDPLNRDAARELSRAIAKVAVPRVTTVIYSHGHRDHASGADALGGSPVVMAHRGSADDIAQRRYDDVQPPTQIFDGAEHRLQLGGEEVRLITLHGVHSDALTAVYFPSRRLLYAVDLVWPNQVAPPAAPLSYAGVERALDQLLKLDFDTFVPGHGAVVTRREVVRYREFLRDMRAQFHMALRRHGLDDLHRRATYLAAPAQLGPVFFEVIDGLRPGYGRWENYDQAILSAVQWCFWSVLTGD
jgi:glyoxylase-like metal-dependent hydrolase (beta-lactamase superfamily II)